MPPLQWQVPLKLGSRADRFHNLKNLGEEVEGLLARHLGIKRRKKVQETLEEHIPIEHATRSVRRSRHQWRVGMGQSTVGTWLEASAYPETTRGPYVSRLAPSLPYLFRA